MSAHNILQQMSEAKKVVADPGAGGTIQPGDLGIGICEIVSATAESRYIGDPVFHGQILVIVFVEDGGTVQVDFGVPTLDNTGNQIAEFDNVRDTAVFMSVGDGAGDYRWQVLILQGATVTT